MKKYSSFRIILLAMGIVAILALTGMNLYSLYALHVSAVESSVERQRDQLEDLVLSVRARMWQPVTELWQSDLYALRESLDLASDSSAVLYDVMKKVEEDPLYRSAYFIQDDRKPCEIENGVYSVHFFDAGEKKFLPGREVPDRICDGITLARTRMRVLAPEFKWPVRGIFESSRTFTIALFNTDAREIIGYLSLDINQQYLVEEIIGRELLQRFGSSEESGISIWLDDWSKREMVVSNSEDVSAFTRSEWDYIQRFPNMLEDWNIKMRYLETPEAAASRASFIRNVSLLAVAVFLLVGSLVFMYVAAQRERELSMRQASFLANVTHELKTPLAVMQAAGENLSDGRVTTPERLSSYGKHIYSESLRLRRMIEKLLDVAKNEAGQLILKPAVLNLGHLVQQYIEPQRSYLQAKGVKIDLQIDKHAGLVKIDQNSFETILGNLVENAVKYSTSEKYLGVRVFNKNKQVVVEVEDHGAGIPEASQKLIFDKFYRVEESLTARTKGHGLGLAIVKNLTERNGGSISLKSTYGKGSVFAVSFPKIKKESELVNNGKAHNQKEVESEYV
ncbi:MAG: sensor histidine kinase [Cyclonatronaceae bacterium]